MPPSDPPSEQAVATLYERVDGRVLHPGDAGYGDARSVWNGRFDQYPSFIICCTDTADVVASVDFVREEGLPVAVKGGGHDYAGYAVRDDGVVIDCSALDAIEIDPAARVARIGPGLTWAEIDERTQEFGLATTGATVSSVGVAGYTLGGGTGHLARRHGLAVDNLRAAEVVTAAGNVVQVDHTDHSDLFWAIRGGGGNFGVITEFEFDLHPVGPEILAGQVVYPFDAASDVLRQYRSFMADAPPEVNCYAFLIRIPELPAFPAAVHGDMAVDLVASYAGDVDAGTAALEPIRTFGDPILDGLRPQPYTEFQQAFDDGAPKGERWYSKAQYLEALPDEAIDAFIDATDPLQGPYTMVYLEPMGGAIADVESDATAFPHRDAAFSMHALAGWSDPERDAEMIDWTDAVSERMAPYGSGGVYVNLLNRAESDRVPMAYGENYERLRDVKAEWDPGNLFETNQNIEPAD